MSRTILIASIFLAFSAVGLAAQSDPIATREATMRSLSKIWYGQVRRMSQGKIPYDQKTVDLALTQTVAAAKLMPTLFPDTAKTGEKTKALPAVWTDKADLVARYKKMGDDAASYKGKITSLQTLQAAFPVLDKNCDDCHEKFRARGS